MRQYVRVLVCLVGLLLAGLAPGWAADGKVGGMNVRILVRELQLQNGKWVTAEVWYKDDWSGSATVEGSKFITHVLRPWANQLENVLELEIVGGEFWTEDWNQMREMSTGLRNLRSFKITDGVKVVKPMGDYDGASTLNSACRYLEVHKLERVGANAFYEAQLETVLLPDVKRIGKRAFHGNTRLSVLDIKNVKFIGAEAFRNCVMLNSIELLKIDSIDHSAFKGCVSLNYVKINIREQKIKLREWNEATHKFDSVVKGYPFPYCDMSWWDEVPQHYEVFSECAKNKILIPCDERGEALTEREIRSIFSICRMWVNRGHNHPHMEWNENAGWQGLPVGISSIAVAIYPEGTSKSGDHGSVYAPPRVMPGSDIELKPFLHEGYTLSKVVVSYMENGRLVSKFVDGRTISLPNGATNVQIVWTAKVNEMKLRINGVDWAASSIQEGLNKAKIVADQVESLEVYGGCVEECDWRTMSKMYKAESIRVKPTVEYCTPARSTRTSLGSSLRWDNLKYLELAKMDQIAFHALGLEQLVGNKEIQLELFPNVTYIADAGLEHKKQKVRVVGLPARPPYYKSANYKPWKSETEWGDLGRAFLVPVTSQGVPLEGRELEESLNKYKEEYDKFCKTLKPPTNPGGWYGRSLEWLRAKVEASTDGELVMNSPFGVYGRGETPRFKAKNKVGKVLKEVYFKTARGVETQGTVEGTGASGFLPPLNEHVTVRGVWGDAAYEVRVKSPIEHGKVEVSSGSANYQQKIVITCTPENGYRIVRGSVQYTYTDAASGKEVTKQAEAQADGTYEFEMPNASVTVSAEFESQLRFKILQDPAMTNGKVKVRPEQDDYAVKSLPVFTAVPNQGFLRDGELIEYALSSEPDKWMEIPKGHDPHDPKVKVRVLEMPESDILVRAQFKENPNAKYKVTIDSKYADGMIAALPAERLAPGDTVHLKFTPPRGLQFKDVRYCEGSLPSGPWKMVGPGNSFAMPESDVFITADTVANPNAKWSVTVDPTVPEGFLSPEPKEKIEWGERVYIRQTYDPRVYDLVPGSVKWSRKTDPPEWRELDNTWTLLMPDGDVILTAKFVTKPGHEMFTIEKEVDGRGTLTVIANGEALANGSSVRMNTEIEILTEPADGYVLNKVILNGEEYREGKFTVTVRENITMKAYFAEGETTDVAAQHALEVSPNPFGNELHIAGEGLKRVTMFSMMGLEVLRISNGFDHVGTQHLPAGVYVMRVEWQDGSISTHRLVRK